MNRRGLRRVEVSISEQRAEGSIVRRPVLGYRTRIPGVQCHWQRPFWRLVHEGSGLGLSVYFLNNSADLQEAISSLREISEHENLDWTLDVANLPMPEKRRYLDAVAETMRRVDQEKSARYANRSAVGD